MSQNIFLVIIAALFILLVWSNMMYRKAAKNLQPDKQIDLSEVQRSYQMWSIGLILGLMVLFFILQKMNFLSFEVLAGGFMGVILLVYGGIAYLTYSKMKRMEFDAAFMRSYLLVNLVRLLSIVLLIGVLLLKQFYFKV